MRYPWLLLVLFATACNNTIDKKNEDTESKGIDSSEVIRSVLAYADNIGNAMASLKRDSVDLEGLSTEGGELFYYKNADSATVLLEAKNYGETGQNEEKIWLKGKQPALEYLKEMYYDKPMYEPGSKISNTTITYVVFHNNVLFAVLDSARQRIPADSATLAEKAERIKAVLPDYFSQAGIK